MDNCGGSLAAIVMAGGRGQRMGVLCAERAKPALPFGGNRRVIDFVLDNCLNSQANSLAVLVDYQAADLNGYLRLWQAVHKTASLTTLPPKFGSYRGTADAVYQNLDYVLGTQSEDIVIGAGDHIYEMDYRRMLRFHRENRADVTVATIRVPLQSAHRFGVVITDANGKIEQFVEKSSEPISNLASMGIYIFRRDILVKRLAEDAANPNSPHDFGYAILPAMVRRDRVFSYPFDGYWRDIGTIDSYYEASMELLTVPRLKYFRSEWPFSDARLGLLGTEVPGGLVNSIVGAGCVIHGLVQSSILSDNVFVDEKTVIRDSIILPGCRIGSNCLIERHILDENVRVEDHCKLVPNRPGQARVVAIAKDSSIFPQRVVSSSGA